MNDPQAFRADVQALRGIAVLLVVAFHAWPAAVPGGYVGVDVFFVISGYLITGILLREAGRSGRIDFAAFYAGRLRRLLPAALLVIGATVLLAAWRRPPLEAAHGAATALSAIGYVSNLWLAHQAVDYLQDGVQRDLLLHTWSLAVEEQFYLLWPALLALALRWQRGAGLRALAWTVAAVSLASFVLCLWWTRALPHWAFFGLPARAWELGAGALLALLPASALRLGTGLRRAVVLAGLAAIAAAAFGYSSRTPFPGPAAALPVLGALLVIAAGSGPGGAPAAGWRPLVPLQRLGDWSYAWYLWHWPVLILIGETWPGAGSGLLGVALSLALAWWTYHHIEQPVRQHAGLRADPRRSFVAALLLMAMTAAIAIGVQVQATRGSAFGRAMELASRDRPRLYDDKCFAAALDTEPPVCRYGAPGQGATIVLFGDSHAAQWFPAVERLALARGLQVQVFVKAACPVAAIEPFDHRLNRPYVECTAWRERVFARLQQVQPRLVIVADDDHYDAFVSRDAAAQARWRDGLQASLQRLRQLSPQVVMLRDTPRPGFRVPACLAAAQAGRAEAPVPDCHYLLADAVQPAAVALEQALLQGPPGLSLVDLNDAICATPVCPVQRAGTVLFHDAQHLSASFTRSLADLLWQRLPAEARADLVR